MARGHEKKLQDGDLMSKKTKNPRIRKSHTDVKVNTVTFKLIG